MEDWAELVNSKGEKGGNMYDRAKGLGRRSHFAKFSIGVLILFVFLTMVGDYDCLANGFNPFKLLNPGFAVFVVGVSHSDPSRAVGPPDKKYVSLGKEDGYIVATMGAPFTNVLERTFACMKLVGCKVEETRDLMCSSARTLPIGYLLLIM